jgi:hypothetical protein
VPWILDEIFSYATRFIFANAACYPALTTLPNGENAHCTLRPAEWWQAVFTAAASSHSGVMWKLAVESHDKGDKPPAHD